MSLRSWNILSYSSNIFKASSSCELAPAIGKSRSIQTQVTNNGSGKNFQRVQRAWETLRCPQQRLVYDSEKTRDLVVALEVLMTEWHLFLPIWIIHSKNCIILCVCFTSTSGILIDFFPEALKRIAKSFVIGQPNKQLPLNKGQRCTGTRIYGRHRRNACARHGCWVGGWFFFPPKMSLETIQNSFAIFGLNCRDECMNHFFSKNLQEWFFLTCKMLVGTASVFSWSRQNLRFLG